MDSSAELCHRQSPVKMRSPEASLSNYRARKQFLHAAGSKHRAHFRSSSPCSLCDSSPEAAMSPAFIWNCSLATWMAALSKSEMKRTTHMLPVIQAHEQCALGMKECSCL